MCRNTFAGPPATFGDHPTAADSTAGGGLRGFPGGLVDRQRAEFRGVDLDAVRTRVAARLYGADQPDDVQVTVAGQFALRPSMFQEVVGDQRSVVQLHGRHAGAREIVQHAELRAAVVEVPDIDHQAGVGRPGPAQQVHRAGDIGNGRPRKGLDGDQQVATGQPVGDRPQSTRRRVGVQRPLLAAAELTGADMPPAERIRDVLDVGEGAP